MDIMSQLMNDAKKDKDKNKLSLYIENYGIQSFNNVGLLNI
jgi:hypothetical protein